ncbi:MAG: hypothetical protein JWO09_776 [Bacteroidetes bacterium]|nr:hypothetical protein [Bacteroidota bacterium]
MALSIQESNPEKHAHLISQRFGIFSDGPAIGTTNLINCMGIIIHNNMGEMGILAHIEARTDENTYLKSIQTSLQIMVETLKSKGKVGTVSVVLMGNMSNRSREAESLHNQELEKIIYRSFSLCQLNKFNLYDMRGGIGGIGAGKKISGNFSTCLYEPKENKLWVWVGGIKDIKTSASSSSSSSSLASSAGPVTEFKIQ